MFVVSETKSNGSTRCRGSKVSLRPAIICQVYQLVASQTSIILYSFKIIRRISFVYWIIGVTRCRYF